jgi:hypothetical protein
MNEERPGLWLRQTEHIHGHLWHRYFVIKNWPKEKVQKDTLWSTKHAHDAKDQVIRTPLKPGMKSGAPEG